ncbi:MAG: hypothetical protein WDZ51_18685 [Pirellulaceae bacterium]
MRQRTSPGKRISSGNLGMLGLLVASLLPGSLLSAAPPAATLLPATTKSYLSIPDYEQAKANFEQTQLGKLLEDEAMEPFMEDLKKQIQSKLVAGGIQMGIELRDLQGVYGGEICVAAIKPRVEPSDAVALLVDVTGKLGPAQALLRKITAHQIEQGAQQSDVKIAGLTVKRFQFPLEAGQMVADQALYIIHQDLLIASDDPTVIAYILGGLDQTPEDSLAQHAAFVAVKERVDGHAQDAPYDFRWWVEPLGHAEVARSQAGGRRRRGKDYLALMRNQGFDAIQGIGGAVRFSAGEVGAEDRREMEHRTYIFAPADPKAEEGERFRLGARVLDFPNVDSFDPPSWVPSDLATYLNFRWKMKEAFFHSESIVNDYADDEIFYELIESLKIDPAGPRVDIVEEIVNHLGEEVVLLTDHELPIHPQSERRLIAVKLRTPDRVKVAVDRVLRNDPNARPHKIGEHDAWEISEEEEEIPTLMIVGPGYPEPVAQNQPGDNEQVNIPNAAVSVAGEWLYFSNNMDLLKLVLTPKDDTEDLLENSDDFKRVATHLEQLGAGSDSFRQFARGDKAVRVTYELMRQNKMPEAESLLGRMLTELWTEGEEGAARRDQEIDASKLPPFEAIEEYLGPAGLYSRSEEDGWLIVGGTLAKE